MDIWDAKEQYEFCHQDLSGRGDGQTEIGGCEWCGCPIYGSIKEVGCKMICEDCEKADEEAAGEDIKINDTDVLPEVA